MILPYTALFNLTQCEPKLRLQSPVILDEIELAFTQRLVMDEILFNPVGLHLFFETGKRNRPHIEFSTQDFFNFAKTVYST